jgi:hypothetical protein
LLMHLPKLFYVALAIASYFIVHQLHLRLAALGDPAKHYVEITYWVQFILPICFLIAALLAGSRKQAGDRLEPEMAKPPAPARSPQPQRARRSARSAGQEPVVKVDPFRKMTREAFDELIREFFTRNGFTIEPGPPVLGDAVDFCLRKNDKMYLVQCRYWREHRVDLSLLRQQFTILQAAKAHGIYVVTSGEFSYKAIEFAEERSITLIDGLKLRRLLKKPQLLVSDYPVGDSRKAPDCPLCGRAMVLKTGSAGADIGKRYWSCSDSRRCEGRISIRQ